MLVQGCIFAYRVKYEKIKEKRDELKKLHKTRMGLLYISSISGAGAVRLTVWLQWILGKFFR